MSMSRRRFVIASGSGLSSLPAGRLFAQNITEFSTIKTELFFEVDQGRQNPIRFSTGSPGFPPLEPTPDFGNVVLYWLVKMSANSAKVAQEIRLSLYRPLPSTNPSLTPPSYGLGSGHYLLRYPLGNNTFPRKEDTQLWADYVAPNWQIAPGSHDTIDAGIFQTELAGTQWPGQRALAQWQHGNPGADPGFWPTTGVPLRVSIPGLGEEELLLALFELKRYGRLYLIAEPMRVKPIISSGICFVATAAYGSCHSPEVTVLRRWRDEVLMRDSLGRLAVNAYYRISPPIARMIANRKILRRLVRMCINPLARHLERWFQPKP